MPVYFFIEEIAKQFQCEGIRWDTICIPKEKAARSKAINKTKSNYKNARITWVYDCLLRKKEWVDAEAACFATIISQVDPFGRLSHSYDKSVLNPKITNARFLTGLRKRRVAMTPQG
jgi:hypothetical protein